MSDIDRPARVKRVAAAHTERAKRARQGKGRPMAKRALPKPRERVLIAYDLETSRIEAGTPSPCYITAYGDAGFFVSRPVRDILDLCNILADSFLIESLRGCRFIAWAGNNYDAYFIGAALLHSNDYIIRPYLTKSNNLRGFKVFWKADEKIYWEFLDGIAMTGIQKPLAKFLEVFAPDYLKLDAPDWATENFDPANPAHRRYAERDSEGLYRGIKRANDILLENFGIPLQPTIGNCGIKVFMSFIPDGVKAYSLDQDADHVVRSYVMRGGFCHAARLYDGPVWKYDINQAYAAAMREADLPAGKCYFLNRETSADVCGIWKVDATAPPGNRVPLYVRNEGGGSVFAFDGIQGAWITSIELRQLRAEGWRIRVHCGFWWDSSFRMKHYVDSLEHLRVNGPGGPKGAQGEMVKALGNNSYGKTVETLSSLELIMALECPPGFSHYQNHDDRLQHIWFTLNAPEFREYHQPQIGAFITAHVRMVVRRAALLYPEGWLYADTDCVMFDAPVVGLDIDPSRYGAWKIECENKNYRVITKKVYADYEAKEKHAKGMVIKELTAADFEKWFNGDAPVQRQTQRNNFLKVMAGDEMFLTRERRGSKLDKRSVAQKK